MKYTVTNMAQKLGVSPAEINQALADIGLQTQVTVESDLPGSGKRRKWVATEEGLTVSEVRKGNKGLNPYEILLWDFTVLTALGHVKPPSRADFVEVQAHIVNLDELVRASKEEAATTRRQVWVLSDQVQVLQGQVQLLTDQVQVLIGE